MAGAWQWLARDLSSGWRFAAAVVVVSLALRLAWVLGFCMVPIPAGSDEVDYWAYAEAMLSGPQWLWIHISPQPPGYPAFLVGMTFLFGRSPVFWQIKVLQAAISAASVAGLFLLARRFLGPWVAAGTALWACAYFEFVRYAGYLLRETPAVLLMLLFVAAFLATRAARPWRSGWIPAVPLFLLVHMDARFLFHLPFAFGYALLADDQRPRAVRRYLAMAAAFCALSLPWFVRNLAVYGRPVVVNTQAMEQWTNFVKDGGKDFRPDVEKPPTLAAFEEQKRRLWSTLPSEECASLRGGVRPAYTRIGRHLFLFLEFWRFCAFEGYYRPYPDLRHTKWSLAHNLLGIAFTGVFLPFAVVGAVVAVWRRHRPACLLAAVTLVHWLLHGLVHSRDRYRLPVMAFVVMLAFYAVAALVARRTEAVAPSEAHPCP